MVVKNYKMDREMKERMKAQMDRMDEEMSMLAKRFQIEKASDVIAMHRNYMMWKMERFGLEVYGNTGGEY